MTAVMWFVLVVMANGMLAVLYENYATINKHLGSSMRTSKTHPIVKTTINAGFLYKPANNVPGSMPSFTYTFRRK